MSVAKTYARALFETLKSPDDSMRVRDELGVLNGVFESSKELKSAMFGPATSAEEKLGVLKKLKEKTKTSEDVFRFLTLLINKGRLSEISEIWKNLDEIRLESQGGTLGQIESADPLESHVKKSLEDAFSKKLGRTVEFRVTTNPKLLAGLRVTVNGVTYDGSMRNQLDRLRESFVKGSSASH